MGVIYQKLSWLSLSPIFWPSLSFSPPMHREPVPLLGASVSTPPPSPCAPAAQEQPAPLLLITAAPGPVNIPSVYRTTCSVTETLALAAILQSVNNLQDSITGSVTLFLPPPLLQPLPPPQLQLLQLLQQQPSPQ